MGVFETEPIFFYFQWELTDHGAPFSMAENKTFDWFLGPLYRGGAIHCVLGINNEHTKFSAFLWKCWDQIPGRFSGTSPKLVDRFVKHLRKKCVREAIPT